MAHLAHALQYEPCRLGRLQLALKLAPLAIEISNPLCELALLATKISNPLLKLVLQGSKVGGRAVPRRQHDLLRPLRTSARVGSQLVSTQVAAAAPARLAHAACRKRFRSLLQQAGRRTWIATCQSADSNA